MSADAGYGPTPVNQILVAGNPLLQFLRIEDVDDMRPGRLVKRGSTDGEIVVNTVLGPAVGWLGYEQTIKKFRPATVDDEYTTYTSKDIEGTETTVYPHVAVLHGEHFIIVGRLKSGQSVAKGARLSAAAAGELAARGSVTSGGVTVYTDTVAIAEETVNATAAAADIMVRSLI